MLAAFVSSTASMFASEFIPMGDLPGATFFSTAEGVSDDGTVVVGDSRSTASGGASNEREAYRWSEADGMVGLGYLENGDFLSQITHGGSGVSGDGNVIVGGSGRHDVSEAFRWTDTTGLTGLGQTPDGRQTRATAASQNGDVIVGHTSLPYRAWYWTEDEGVINLSDEISRAYDVSGDGEVIVGTIEHGVRFQGLAFRWTRDDGIQRLDAPESFEQPTSIALAVSADGSAITGLVGEFEGDVNQPFLWDAENGMRLLGQLDDLSGSANGRGVSNDGEVVVGLSFNGGKFNAFIWNDNLGMLDLKTVLQDEYGLGEALSGWELSAALDISPNGRFIVGNGTNPQGHHEGWLVRLDYPFLGSPIIGDFNDDKVVDGMDLAALGVSIQVNSDDLRFDLDDSGEVGISDINAMVETVLGTWIGDSNFDGQFNSRDLVTVFQSSQYEDSIDGNSSWETGDWNLDGDFTTADLVFAFQDGGYERGRRELVMVPEPGSTATLLIVLLLLMSGRRAGSH